MNGSQRTKGNDKRGNARNRRARRQFLWEMHGGYALGYVFCKWCKVRLAVNEFQIDRYPICGHDGGKYLDDNIVPACEQCNATRCTANCRGHGH